MTVSSLPLSAHDRMWHLRWLSYGIVGLFLGFFHFTFALPRPLHHADIMTKVPVDCSEMKSFLHGTEFTVRCPRPDSHFSLFSAPTAPHRSTSRMFRAEYHGSKPFRIALQELKKVGAVQVAMTAQDGP